MLAAPIPERWGLWQRTKNAVLYVLIRIVVGCVQLIPFTVARLACLSLAALAPLVARRECRIASRQLQEALPELDEAGRRRIIRRMFLHFGESVAELTHVARFVSGRHAARLAPEDHALIEAALAEGKGAVIVAGHIGNWELIGHMVANAGFPVVSVAKPLYDPRLTRFAHRTRTAHGMQIIWRGDDSVSQEIRNVFASGGMLALLIDQDTKVRGDFVRFFGKPAHTATAAAAFALRAGAPVLVAWGHRVAKGRHRVHFERLPMPASGDLGADILAITAQATARLEAAIRACPEQWVWFHRRWKTQPPVAAVAITAATTAVAPVDDEARHAMGAGSGS